MDIRLNLASNPYQDEGRFYAFWGASTLVILALSGVLVFFAVQRFRTVHASQKRIDALQTRIRDLQKTRDEAERELNLPQNRGTRERSQFLNTAILRKSFSWTEVLADLERIMPPRIHVTSIEPKLDKQQRITVTMSLTGTDRDAAIELVRRMEKSSHFRQAELVAETDAGNAAGQGRKFDVQAFYAPGPSDIVPKPPSKESPEKSKPAAAAKEGD